MTTVKEWDDGKEALTVREAVCYWLNPAEGRIEGGRVHANQLTGRTPGAAEGTEGYMNKIQGGAVYTIYSS